MDHMTARYLTKVAVWRQLNIPSHLETFGGIVFRALAESQKYFNLTLGIKPSHRDFLMLFLSWYNLRTLGYFSGIVIPYNAISWQ